MLLEYYLWRVSNYCWVRDSRKRGSKFRSKPAHCWWGKSQIINLNYPLGRDPKFVSKFDFDLLWIVWSYFLPHAHSSWLSILIYFFKRENIIYKAHFFCITFSCQGRECVHARWLGTHSILNWISLK